MSEKRTFGIEKINVYPTALSLNLEDLARVRGYDVAHMHKELMVKERGVNPPWEDTVTMAVNAAKPMLSKEDIASIGLLILATETGLDGEKALSSWVFEYLGLPSACRHFEVKIACYSGTAALKMAIGWLSSGLAKKGQKALIITTDESLNSLHKPWEYVCGGGSAAMLISDKPDFLELEVEKYGIYAHEVADVIRPLPWLETGNSEHSLFSYMEALAATYEDYTANVGDIDFDTYFKKNVYHVPFSGISFRAHKQLMRMSSDADMDAINASFAKKVMPSITYAQRIGGTYGGSVFIAMLATICFNDDLQVGDRIGVFSYGSGSCAEYYSMLVTPKSKEVAQKANLKNILDARFKIQVPQYEVMEAERDKRIQQGDYTPNLALVPNLYETAYQGKGLLVYTGSKGFYRSYKFS
ncbi:MAG: hydroxymethylglutaryl-CoA synthase family protein [Bacteroidetes bacterium]|nr:hydroxymethylglutaryl-CoA synthase family protein [Bacteroidota bacterium]